MAYSLTMAGLAAVLGTLFTLTLLKEYGVNRRNHRLFVKLVWMKFLKRSGMECGVEIARYVLDLVRANGKGRYDISPVLLLTGGCQDDALGVVVGELLANGYKPVSIDRTKGVAVVVG